MNFVLEELKKKKKVLNYFQIAEKFQNYFVLTEYQLRLSGPHELKRSKQKNKDTSFTCFPFCLQICLFSFSSIFMWINSGKWLLLHAHFQQYLKISPGFVMYKFKLEINTVCGHMFLFLHWIDVTLQEVISNFNFKKSLNPPPPKKII